MRWRCRPRSRHLTRVLEVFVMSSTADLASCVRLLTLPRLFNASLDSVRDDLSEHVRIDCGSRLRPTVGWRFVHECFVGFGIRASWKGSRTVLKTWSRYVASRTCAGADRLRVARPSFARVYPAAHSLGVGRAILECCWRRGGSVARYADEWLAAIVGCRSRTAVTVEAVVRIVCYTVHVHVCSCLSIARASTAQDDDFDTAKVLEDIGRAGVRCAIC
jgi:hypothetical protein